MSKKASKKKTSKKKTSKKPKALEPKVVEMTAPTPPPAPKVKEKGPRTHCSKHNIPLTIAKSGKSRWCVECDREARARAKGVATSQTPTSTPPAE